MWCKHCRQDVPAIAAPEESVDLVAARASSPGVKLDPASSRDQHEPARYLCARCGEPVGSEPQPGLLAAVSELGIDLSEGFKFDVASGEPAPASADADFRAWDWELDQDLYDVRRLLDRRGKLSAVETEPGQRGISAMVPAVASAVPETRVRSAGTSHPVERPSLVSPLAWLLLMLGLAATICGGVLLVWSAVGARNELWTRGLPIAIGGQAAMFCGVLLVLGRIARYSRQSALQMREFDQRLAGWKPAAHDPATVASPQTFYTHLAEGARPHLLLNDLKNQLDLLAIRLSREER